jgi:hypothetical protein
LILPIPIKSMPKSILFKSLGFALAVFSLAAVGSSYRGFDAVMGPSIVHAQASSSTGDVVLTPPIKDASGNGLGLEGIIAKVTGFIFWLGITLCPIFIVWGGFNIATAAGDEAKVRKGKDLITYAVIGLVIIAISTAMANAVKTILGAT